MLVDERIGHGLRGHSKIRIACMEKPGFSNFCGFCRALQIASYQL
jgi:hypothetical protein